VVKTRLPVGVEKTVNIAQELKLNIAAFE